MKQLGLNLALNPAGVGEAGVVTASQGQVVSNGRLTSAATFTRADTATYFDSSGTLQTAAANEPRTTYIDGNPYLFMEGARTNLLTRSEELDHGAWVKQINVVITANAELAPDGTLTAEEYTHGATSSRAIWQTVPGGAVAGADFTFSFYIKPKTELSAAVRLELHDGGVGGTMVGVNDVSVPGTDWTRISVSGTFPDPLTGGGDVTPSFFLPSDLDTAYIWGAQLEQGLHRSSYIKTTDAAASRSADVASLTNSIISSLTEGTIYAEVWVPQLTSNATRTIAKLESDANNFIDLRHATDGDLDAQVTSGGVSQATLSGTDLTVGTKQKIALAFDGSDYALYRDGTQEAMAASGTMPSVDTLLIGEDGYLGIKTLNVYPSRLSNTELASLTT